MFIIRRAEKCGAAGGRRQRARHRRQQAGIRPAVRRAQVHAGRRTTVASLTTGSGRRRPAGSAQTVGRPRVAAAAGGTRGSRRGGLAATHAPQARHVRRAARTLVLGAHRELGRGHARASPTIRDRIPPSAAGRVSRPSRFGRRGHASSVHFTFGGGRVSGLVAQGSHLFQPPRFTSLPHKGEVTR